MNLEELRSVQRTERQKDSLQHLRDSFYEDVAAYIEERKAERRRAADAADEPFGDPEVGRLTDEIETAEDVVEAIYERRSGKVVKLASFAAADMGADTDGLTAEERELFEDLVARIKRNRRTVLDVLAGEGGEGGDSDVTASAEEDGIESAEGRTGTSADHEAEPGSEPRADPVAADSAPAPDDVLAEAMGGAESVGSEPGAESDPDAPAGPDSPSTGSGPAVPPDDPPEAVEREAAVVDGDGGEAVDPARSEDDPVSDGGARPTAGSADAAPEGGSGAARSKGGADARSSAGDATDRVTLRITEDVGRILGVDEREYDLESEDVVTLPTTNAGPLLERDAAERLD